MALHEGHRSAAPGHSGDVERLAHYVGRGWCSGSAHGSLAVDTRYALALYAQQLDGVSARVPLARSDADPVFGTDAACRRFD